MSQTKIIISVVVALMVVGGGYIALKQKNVSTPNPVLVQTEPTQESDSGKKMSFLEFIKQGGSYKCTVSQYVNDTETKGVTYMDGGKIRGEYDVSVEGMDIKSILIVRDGYTYTWTSMAPEMGFKAKVIEGEASTEEVGTSGTYSFDAKQIGGYDCQPWSPDASMFTVPEGITFTEIK